MEISGDDSKPPRVQIVDEIRQKRPETACLFSMLREYSAV